MQSKVQNLDGIVCNTFSPLSCVFTTWSGEASLGARLAALLKKIQGRCGSLMCSLKLNKNNVNEEVKVKGADPTFH